MTAYIDAEARAELELAEWLDHEASRGDHAIDDPDLSPPSDVEHTRSPSFAVRFPASSAGRHDLSPRAAPSRSSDAKRRASERSASDANRRASELATACRDVEAANLTVHVDDLRRSWLNTNDPELDLIISALFATDRVDWSGRKRPARRRNRDEDPHSLNQEGNTP